MRNGPTLPPVLLAACLAAALAAGCTSLNYRDPIKDRSAVVAGLDGLERFVRGRVAFFGVEKASIAVVAAGELVYARGFGMGADEPMQAASIAKPVVAYAALSLVEAGRLELDAPLSAYLAEPYFEPGSPGEAITLRQALSHTAGMSNASRDRRVYAPPGQAFHYSGAGFEYVRVVLEAVTGEPLDRFIAETVFVPLGMKASRFISLDKQSGTISAAGGLVSTPSDIAKFFLELTAPTLISQATVDLMLSDVVRLNERNYWGLGIARQHGDGQEAIWHSGNNGNLYRALAYFELGTRTGAVIMAKGKNSYRILQDSVHAAVGGSYYGLVRNINNTGLK